MGAFSSVLGSLFLFGIGQCGSIHMGGRGRAIRLGVLGFFSLLGILLIGYTWKGRIAEENWPPISVQQRAIQWKVALHMIGENPILGSGWGNYQTDFLGKKMEVFRRHPASLNYEIPSQAHNDLLQFWAEAGLLPFGLVLVLLGRTVREGLRFLRSDRSRFAVGLYRSGVLVCGCLFGVIAILGNGLVNFPFHAVHSAMLAVFLLSLSLCVVHGEFPVNKEVKR
jgi:O-antigen ligase